MNDSENDNIRQADELPALRLNEEMENLLYQTASWARAMAIIGFIFVTLLLVAAVLLHNVLAPGGGDAVKLPIIHPSRVVMVDMLIAVLYLIPTISLYRFSTNCREGIKFSSQLQLNFAFVKLRSYFMFWGIVSLLVTLLYLVLLGGVVVGAVGVFEKMR